MHNTHQKTRVNLEHRLEALSIALKNLTTDPLTEGAARELVALVRASCDLNGLTDLAQSARRVELSPSAQIETSLRELITLMRLELVRQDIEPITVLVVTSEPELGASIRQALEARGRNVIVTESARDALQIVLNEAIAVIVVDQFLSDEDGRDLITELRSHPSSAAKLIIAIGPRPVEPEAQQFLGECANLYFDKPVDPIELADYLIMTLKRGAKVGQEARRDSISGLLNRAAFYESYQHLSARQTDSRHPLALAMIGIHQFETLATACSPEMRGALIRQLGTILSSALRATDVVARWGHSEFVVLLADEDLYGATCALNKILPLLNRETVTTSSGHSIPLTLCAGLTILGQKTPIGEATATAELFLQNAYAGFLSDSDQKLFSDIHQTRRTTTRIGAILADPDLAQTVRLVIEQNGYDVELFSNPKEALLAIEAERIHLLIVDTDCPEPSGFRLLEHLQQVPPPLRPKVFVIVSSTEAIVRALDIGAGDYAVKPLSYTPFITRIRRLSERPPSLTPRR
jgi:diguanylate cyclase (GGDEF)-like protein